MILDFTDKPMRRRPQEITWTDITSSVMNGEPTWTGPTTMEIPMSPEPPPAEVELIRLRMTTASDGEESLHKAVQKALAANRNFRDNIVPPILTRTTQIEQDSAITSQETFAYLRSLARDVRALAEQVDSLSRQNIGLCRLVLNRTDGVD